MDSIIETYREYQTVIQGYTPKVVLSFLEEITQDCIKELRRQIDSSDITRRQV